MIVFDIQYTHLIFLEYLLEIRVAVENFCESVVRKPHVWVPLLLRRIEFLPGGLEPFPGYPCQWRNYSEHEHIQIPRSLA